MYSINIPIIKEKLMLGNDIIYFNVIDISTTDCNNHVMEQREIRFGITPIEISISRHYKQCTKIGLNLCNRFSLNIEFVYEKPKNR